MNKNLKTSLQIPPHYKGGMDKSKEKPLTMEAPYKKHGQGQYANSASISDNAEKPVPRTQERGVGNSFAMAVDHVLNNSKNVKEQGAEFTNPNVATLPANELGKQFGKSFQPEGFNHKKKLNE